MLLNDGTELVFRIREHPRARRVRIAVSSRAGMVVTIPHGFDRGRIPEILERKRDWIERAPRRYPMKPEPYRPPERIVLQAVGEEWAVEYETGAPRHVTLVKRGDRVLHVSGATNRPDVVWKVLERWLTIQARRHLVPWLYRTAGELDISLKGISVRAQRTLWGSCSRRHTISLNARLLLIPPDMVRYVFVHELVHTRHMNHSREFWRAVAVHVPDYRDRVKELKRLWRALEI
ncbi:MAG: SprT family zinc-dependent metalloprotease [candidate division WOR-3 bacterium]|nr:SprT family zinc-dependent metalloprotease [candidate division WOR-3 bacterium]